MLSEALALDMVEPATERPLPVPTWAALLFAAKPLRALPSVTAPFARLLEEAEPLAVRLPEVPKLPVVALVADADADLPDTLVLLAVLLAPPTVALRPVPVVVPPADVWLDVEFETDRLRLSPDRDALTSLDVPVALDPLTLALRPLVPVAAPLTAVLFDAEFESVRLLPPFDRDPFSAPVALVELVAPIATDLEAELLVLPDPSAKTGAAAIATKAVVIIKKLLFMAISSGARSARPRRKPRGGLFR